MNVFRGIIIFFASLFILGTALTLLLTILTGGTETSILKKFWWLETDCSNFPGSPITSSQCRWTNYGLCSVEDGNNSNCTHAAAAYPFSPSRNFDSNENLPSAFVDNANYYYYTSRVGYGFSLVGLAFLAASWIPFFALLFTKNSLKVLKIIFWVLYTASILFIIPAISLLTASYTKGRNKFRDAGFDAKLGTKPMATAWATVFLLLFNIIFIVFATKEWSNVKFKNYSFKKSLRPASSFDGGWFKRSDIPPSDQIVHTDSQVQPTADGTTANYLSFTPVKETTGANEVRKTSGAGTGSTITNTLYQ